MNRIIHRLLAVVAVLLMLWLGGTGSTIQLLDLNAILTDRPQSDPTQLSIAEGMYGQANFTVIQLRDFESEAFPAGFDIRKALATLLDAVPAPQLQEGGLLNPIAWAELRVVNGAPIGQVMMGTRLEAFDAITGAPVTAVPHEALPQGQRLPQSLRQTLKRLHRFWSRSDTPGVYFEFLAGVILFTLLFTGLVMYFRLLSARARAGRRQIFWFVGGKWRGLHRAVSVLAAAFLLCMAFSGTWIGYESTVSAFRRGGGGPAPGRNPIDFIIPLRTGEIQQMAATTLDAMQRLHPDTQIKAIRLRTYGQMKQGVVITGGQKAGQLVFDADTGRPVSLSEPGYPQVGFPFGVQVHENIKHFHSGELFGVSGRLMNLFAGLSLLFLSVSGLVLYFDMWLKRRDAGRKSFFWR